MVDDNTDLGTYDTSTHSKLLEHVSIHSLKDAVLANERSPPPYSFPQTILKLLPLADLNVVASSALSMQVGPEAVASALAMASASCFFAAQIPASDEEAVSWFFR